MGNKHWGDASKARVLTCTELRRKGDGYLVRFDDEHDLTVPLGDPIISMLSVGRPYRVLVDRKGRIRVLAVK